MTGYDEFMKMLEDIKPMGLDDIFTFGKHSGDQLEDVIEDDPGYIEWLANDGFEFDNEALELLSKKGIA